MNFFNANIDVDGRSFSESRSAGTELLSSEAKQALDFNVHLEKLALFLAQTWKDDHPNATAESEADLSDCILAVTTELAIAAKAVGGPVGLEILSGGGSAAARAVCQQVLNSHGH